MNNWKQWIWLIYISRDNPLLFGLIQTWPCSDIEQVWILKIEYCTQLHIKQPILSRTHILRLRYSTTCAYSIHGIVKYGYSCNMVQYNIDNCNNNKWKLQHWRETFAHVLTSSAMRDTYWSKTLFFRQTQTRLHQTIACTPDVLRTIKSLEK